MRANRQNTQRLPEGVMYSAVKPLIGSAADDLFAILAATGAEAIGDVQVRIPKDDRRTTTVSLQEAAELIESLLQHRNRLNPTQGAAIPGVQPKMSLGAIVRTSRQAAYIAKFESPEFTRLIENEFASCVWAEGAAYKLPRQRSSRIPLS